MNRTKYLITALIILLVVGICLYLHYSDPGSARPKDDLHCPVCGLELPPQARATGECPYCALKALSAKPGTKVLPKRPGFWLREHSVEVLLVGTFLFLAAIHGFLFVRAHWKWRVVAESWHEFRCPSCGRKLRYRASQVGNRAICPTCRKECRLPHPETL